MEFKVIKDDEIRQRVSQRYAKVADGSDSCCGSASDCCSDPMVKPELSEMLGYAKSELGAAPEGANMGLGCGNPQVLAQLRPGETVLDLGSGGGFSDGAGNVTVAYRFNSYPYDQYNSIGFRVVRP